MTFTLGSRAISAGHRLAAFNSIGSTNAEALARARAGERGPIWFLTSGRPAGRGRRHRPWISPRGNLAASVLEAIEISPAIAATLSFAAGLALESALQQVSAQSALEQDEFRLSALLPSPGGGGSASIARCETGWGDSLIPGTAHEEGLSPHPAARCTRVDPPPPGEGAQRPRDSTHRDHALASAASGGLKFDLKWPNDVLAANNKLAGILLEAETMAEHRLAVVVGIGINLVAAPEGTPTPATSLKALGVDIGAEQLFAALSD